MLTSSLSFSNVTYCIGLSDDLTLLPKILLAKTSSVHSILNSYECRVIGSNLCLWCDFTCYGHDCPTVCRCPTTRFTITIMKPRSRWTLYVYRSHVRMSASCCSTFPTDMSQFDICLHLECLGLSISAS